MSKKDAEKYTEISTVEKRENYLTAQEFPEGPYGSTFRVNDPVQNKSTPWKEGQRRYSAFNYEFKSLHEDLPRQGMEPAHPTHDDPDTDAQPPYSMNE
ncbi:cytosolic protein [Bacillus sp. MUM 116]|uniref:cytosolic protein n=1 Tax=Bacillus sp. MUM 116 TaxID=1678002 RepID=UPI0008F5CD76|nr:cytosolic protein [Bacillus sp. MUM 116]OIK10249.1 cytosolic protein [Bacillus sp. MUM 116]